MSKKLAGVVALSVLVATAPVMQAAANSTAFTGAVQSSSRGGSSVFVEGDLFVSDAVCPDIQGNLSRRTNDDRVFLALVDRDSGDFHVNYWGGGGTRVWEATSSYHDGYYRWPIESGATYVSQTFENLPAATYDLAIVDLYSGFEVSSKALVCSTLVSNAARIVDETSSELVTRASSEIVSQGEEVTIELVKQTTWTDGATTDESPGSSYDVVLQRRTIGETQWSVVDRRTAKSVQIPMEPTEYRFLVGNRITKSVFVDVLRPTVARTINNVSISPSAALATASLGITAEISSQFTDGSWRPSPAGTPYSIEFQPTGSQEWTRVFEGQTELPGSIEQTVLMGTSGAYRLSSGSAVSAPVEVTEIVPTREVAFDSLNLPEQVQKRTRLRFRTEVSIQYSDGIYRPASKGTDVQVQFAPVKKPRNQESSPRNKRGKWQTVKRVTIRSSGVLKASTRATRSGYWRIKVGTSKSRASLVQIR